MAVLEERVSFLEGRIVEQSNVLAGIREAVTSLDRRVLHLDVKLDALDSKMSTQFLWVIGIQVSTILAFIATVVAIVRR